MPVVESKNGDVGPPSDKRCQEKGFKEFVFTIEPRFMAIWVALAIMLIIDLVFLPHSVEASTLLAVLPFAAFLTIAAVGQTAVIMARGIDLSAPAIITLGATVLLGVSGGDDEWLLLGVVSVLCVGVLIGAISGVLIAYFKLNALIVTLSVSAVVTGIGIWCRENFVGLSSVPPALSSFCGERVMGLPVSAVLAAFVVIVATFMLRKTVVGRRFELVGTNPDAALVIGIPVKIYQAAAYIVSGLFYGVIALLVSGFIRNPTLDVGNPYLLAPIAAAVLGGTAISGGIGSFVSVLGAALFLTQLDQSIKMLGLSTAWQMIIQGLAIAAGMYLSARLSQRRVRG